MASGFELIKDPTKLLATTAVVQDKRGSIDYPAAHLSPCGIDVGLDATGKPQQLYSVFRNQINSAYLRNVFAETEFVHRLVNYIDGQIDRTKDGDGFSDLLIDACATTIRDRKARPKELLYDVLIPQYKALAGKMIVELTMQDPASDGLQSESQNDGPSRLVDAQGRPFNERPLDTSVNSTSPQAAVYNDHALETIAGAHAGVAAPDSSALQAVDSAFQAISLNEMQSRKS